MAEAPVVQKTGFAWSKAETTAPSAATYRTFPRKIAPTLATIGGTVAFIGSLGVWVRATVVHSETIGPQAAATIWGFDEPTGRALAVLSALVVFVAAITYFTKIHPRLALEAVSLALFVLLVVRVASLDSRSVAMADAARLQPNFESFNAGFGWGAWLLLLAAVLTFLTVLVGGLRELDLWRGKSE